MRCGKSGAKGATRLDALVFGLSLDFKTLNLKPVMRLLLLVLAGGLGRVKILIVICFFPTANIMN